MLRLPCVTYTLCARPGKCLLSMPAQQSQRVLSATCISQNKVNKNNKSVPTSTEWRTIYRLPLIRLASAFNRLKIYQAAIALAGTPICYALEQAGYISLPAVHIFSTLGVSGFVTLTVGSYALKNLIGFIYINEAENHLKLAYVDFWGRRQHALIAIDDLILPWDQDEGSSKISRFYIYQSIKLQSDSKIKYKLLQRFGVITEPETYVGLFGE